MPPPAWSFTLRHRESGFLPIFPRLITTTRPRQFAQPFHNPEYLLLCTPPVAYIALRSDDQFAKRGVSGAVRR